jgi:DNA-binding transcriptional regulator GbsR (MarR family)
LETTIISVAIRREGMTEKKKQAEQMHYVERWGMLYEQLGAPRMMGRVIGLLLICDPPHQTAKEIADAIGASIGSVSTITRNLSQMGMIERFGIPGKRSAYFRIKPGALSQMLKRRVAQIKAMHDLAEEGLHLLSSSDEDSRMRLTEIESYCTFVHRELPALIDRWEEVWRKERSKAG